MVTLVGWGGCAARGPLVPAPPPPVAPQPPPPPRFSELPHAEQTARLVERGAVVYAAHCVRCHGADGTGMRGAFPPLLGPGQVRGDCANHARIVTEGLRGPIVVGGITYDGVMLPTEVSGLDLAAVLTYERTAWGNALGACLPADLGLTVE